MAEDDVKTDLPSGDQVERDWMLQCFVEWTLSGVEMPVVLATSSGIITGNIVSGEAFIQAMEDTLVPAVGENLGGQMRDAFAEWKKPYLADAPGSDDGPHFIHLRNARYVIGNDFVPAEGVMWRGRVSSIQGFSIGVLGRSKV